MDIDTLNSKHSQAGFLVFKEGPEGFPIALITTPHATVAATPYGGQILSCTFTSDPNDLLFLSQKAVFSEGSAIRGGIPVCWPWFGPDPLGIGRSDHGFARTRMWNVAYTSLTPDNECVIAFELTDTPQTLEIWPYRFRLLLRLSVGKSLKIELVTHNTGDEPFEITQALHTYFSVGNINKISINGLEGISYIDKTDGRSEKTDDDLLSIDGETDRIYHTQKDSAILVDPTLNRNVLITSSGSRSLVVWNPWKDICQQKVDLEENDYIRMVCIETANAADDRITVSPGESHTLMAIYTVKSGI